MQQKYKVKKTQEAQQNKVCGKHRIFGEGDVFSEADLLDGETQLKSLLATENPIIEAVKEKELPKVGTSRSSAGGQKGGK